MATKAEMDRKTRQEVKLLRQKIAHNLGRALQRKFPDSKNLAVSAHAATGLSKSTFNRWLKVPDSDKKFGTIPSLQKLAEMTSKLEISLFDLFIDVQDLRELTRHDKANARTLGGGVKRIDNNSALVTKQAKHRRF